MALAAAIVGAKRPSQTITWPDDEGNVFDLTGATIPARIRNRSSYVTVASDGTFTITNAAAGVFRWDYGAVDVTTAGLYEVQFTATFGSNPTPAKSVTELWEVKESI